MEKNKGGRPPKYSKELADEIFEYVASNPVTDADMAKHFGLHLATIYHWKNTKDGFLESYLRAKKSQCALRVEQLYKETYDTSDDVVELGNGRLGINTAAVNRLRIRANFLAHFASKFDPDLFGDKKLEDKVDEVQREFGKMEELVRKSQEKLGEATGTKK